MCRLVRLRKDRTEKDTLCKGGLVHTYTPPLPNSENTGHSIRYICGVSVVGKVLGRVYTMYITYSCTDVLPRVV